MPTTHEVEELAVGPLIIRVVGECLHGSLPPLGFHVASSSLTVISCGTGPSCSPMCGCLRRLKYEVGCFGAPPCEATSA
jgi:hypothetical protein